jgi:hypothetical protein
MVFYDNGRGARAGAGGGTVDEHERPRFELLAGAPGLRWWEATWKAPRQDAVAPGDVLRFVVHDRGGPRTWASGVVRSVDPEHQRATVELREGVLTFDTSDPTREWHRVEPPAYRLDRAATAEFPAGAMATVESWDPTRRDPEDPDDDGGHVLFHTRIVADDRAATGLVVVGSPHGPLPVRAAHVALLRSVPRIEQVAVPPSPAS